MRSWSLIATVTLLAASTSGVAAGQTAGLLVVAHGADAGWNDLVRRTVAQVAWTGPVATAFLMGPEAESAGWDAGVRALAAQGASAIVVVPLMVSSHGSHYRQVRYYAGELDRLPPELAGHDHHHGHRDDVTMVVTRALDGAPEMAPALLETEPALAAAPSPTAPLFLVGHGPSGEDDLAAWERDFERVAVALAEAGGWGEVRHGQVRDDAAPDVRAAAVRALRDTVAALAARGGDSVTVVTILVSRGALDRSKLPADLAGLPMRYRPTSLAPASALARWIERAALAARPRLAAAGQGRPSP